MIRLPCTLQQLTEQLDELDQEMVILRLDMQWDERPFVADVTTTIEGRIRIKNEIE